MKHPTSKIHLSFICLSISIAFLFYSCNNKIAVAKAPVVTTCEVQGIPATSTADPGNYFYIMEMSPNDYNKLIMPHTFRRFIFQLKNINKSNVIGRNEFEIDSYAWKHGTWIKDNFSDKMFLTPTAYMININIPPDAEGKNSFSFANLELRHKDIKKEGLKSPEKIYLVPYYDMCKKIISIRMSFYFDSRAVVDINSLLLLAPTDKSLNPCPPDKPLSK